MLHGEKIPCWNYLKEYVGDPILLISYLRHLEGRSWVTNSQLEKSMKLSLSGDSLMRWILETVPQILRPFVATALTMIHCTTRALTPPEVSTALAEGLASGNLESIDQNALIDVEYFVYEKGGFPLHLASLIKKYLSPTITR